MPLSPPMRHRDLGLASLLVCCALVVTGCGSAQVESSSGAPSQATEERPAPEGRELDPAVEAAGPHLDAFKAASKVISDAFNDDSVEYDEFLRLAEPALEDIDAATTRLAETEVLVEDSKFAPLYRRLIRNFQSQAVGFRRLVGTVKSDNGDGQREETTNLAELGDENAKLVKQMVDYFDA